MKRYWKIGMLVPFIVVCIGFYYIYTARDNYPDYYLKLQAGDQKEASTISFKANDTKQLLTIRSEGSEYQSELSFWESLSSGKYKSPEMEKLQKEYRQFMRGKGRLDSFYQDENVLGYVEIESKYISRDRKTDYRFIVSIYDKKAKSSATFKVEVPMEGNYPAIGMMDVQIIGQTLKLITTNSKSDGSNTALSTYPEVHLYTLNLSKQTMESDKVILSGISAEANSIIGIEASYETDPTVQSHYAVFQKRYTRSKKDSNSNPINEVYKKELFYYDYNSDELKAIQSEALDAILQKQDVPDIWHIKDDIWITDMGDSKEGRVIHYNMAEKGLSKELVIDTKNFQVLGNWRVTLIANNRLYMVGNKKQGASGEVPTLLIADLGKGNILYEGYISQKDNQASNYLILEGMYIQ